MKIVKVILVSGMVCYFAGCCCVCPRVHTTADDTPSEVAILDQKYQRIKSFIIHNTMYNAGGLEVLDVAYKALREKKLQGQDSLVGLEDLWAHANIEGSVLFEQPEKRWGKTIARETSDMLGQTTIGPWQITIWNVHDIYGPPYGVEGEWTNAEVYEWAREHPRIQAKMITDYIQLSYEDYGKRAPYAIQRYFWLEAYVKGEIGQGEWTKSPVAKSPTGRWEDLTPEMKRHTGFYAKQVLLGNAYNQHALLFWLWVTDDMHAIRETLRTWKFEQKRVWEDDKAVLTDEPGNFAIYPEDMLFCDCHPHYREDIKRIAREVLEED